LFYFTSVHDEPCISSLAEYEGFKLFSIQKGEANLGDLVMISNDLKICKRCTRRLPLGGKIS